MSVSKPVSDGCFVTLHSLRQMNEMFFSLLIHMIGTRFKIPEITQEQWKVK